MNNNTNDIVVNINGVDYKLTVNKAIETGSLKPKSLHKPGNFYVDQVDGTVYMLVYYGGATRVSLVDITGISAGCRVMAVSVIDPFNITQTEFDYMTQGMELDQIENAFETAELKSVAHL